MLHKSYPINQNQGGKQMLVLTRRLGEGLIIRDKINKSQIKLDIEASKK